MTSPRGNPVTFTVRDGTNDGSLTYGTMNGQMGYQGDEYGLAARHLTGWALDVGAHIGIISVALAVDNPDLHVVAVEVLPDNVALMRRNVLDNGLGERVHIVEAAAGGPGETSRTVYWNWRDHPGTDPGYAEGSRYIANQFLWDALQGRGECDAIDVPVVSIGAIRERFGIEDIAFAKIDCEGCEWAFLDDPEVAHVETLIGEYHGDDAGETPISEGQAEIRRRLEPTHVVEFATDAPVFGIFTASRR